MYKCRLRQANSDTLFCAAEEPRRETPLRPEDPAQA